MHKNRRKDILPGKLMLFRIFGTNDVNNCRISCGFFTVERSRVKLPLVLGIDGADYINASYIDVRIITMFFAWIYFYQFYTVQFIVVQ